jgi:hypothetical protein
VAHDLVAHDLVAHDLVAHDLVVLWLCCPLLVVVLDLEVAFVVVVLFQVANDWVMLVLDQVEGRT